MDFTTNKLTFFDALSDICRWWPSLDSQKTAFGDQDEANITCGPFLKEGRRPAPFLFLPQFMGGPPADDATLPCPLKLKAFLKALLAFRNKAFGVASLGHACVVMYSQAVLVNR